jgi:hypothetical protein
MLFLQKQVLLHGIVVVVRLCDSHCRSLFALDFMRMVLEIGRWPGLKVPSGYGEVLFLLLFFRRDEMPG